MKHLLLIILALVSNIWAEVQQKTGTSMPPPLPQQVSSFGATSSPNGSVFIYGGHSGKRHKYSKQEVHGTLYRWREGQPDWEALSTDEPAQGASLLYYQERIYRIGGMAARNDQDQKQDLWSSPTAAYYDLTANSWTRLPDLPQRRSSHDSVIIGDVLYVMGGWDLSGGGPRSADPHWHSSYLTLDLSKKNATWQSHPQPFERRALATHAIGHTLYVLGGMNSEEKTVTTLSTLDTRTHTWAAGPDLPTTELGGFGVSSIVVAGQLYASGLTGTLFQLQQDQWTTSGQHQHPRFFHRLISWKNAQVLALGGESKTGEKAPPELLTLAVSRQSDWPCYQGPRGDSTTPETGWLTDWPAEGPPIAWQAQVGIGLGGTSVHHTTTLTAGNDNADTTTVYAHHLHTGQLLWKVSFPDLTRCHAMPIVPYGPASTPTIHDGKAYVLGRNGLLLCLQLSDGAELWRRHFIHDLKGQLPVYGYSSSPYVHADRLYLDIGGTHGSSVCLNAQTGATLWQTGQGQAGYSTPRIITRDGQPYLILFKGETLEIRHPTTGDVIATHPITTRDYCNCSTPYITQNSIFLSNTGSTGSCMLNWQLPQLTTTWSRPDLGLLYNSAVPVAPDTLLIFNDQERKSSQLHLLDTTTGDTRLKMEDITKGTAIHSDDGHTLILSNNGELVLTRITRDKVDILTRHQLLQGKTNIQPTLSHHHLLCKNNAGQLICLNLTVRKN